MSEFEAYSYVNVVPSWDVHVNDLPEGKIESPDVRSGPSGRRLRKVSFWLPEEWLRPAEDEGTENG